MQLAFSTNAYLNFSFADAVARLAAIGYRGVEVMADVPHAWPAYLLPAQKDAIRRALSDNHLAISNVNAFMMHAIDDPRQKYWHPSWVEPDVNYRKARTEHTKRALSLAAELGANCVTTEPGGPVPAGESRAKLLDLFVEELKPVVAHAESVGVKLLIEPEPGLLIETAEDYLEFREKLQSPYLGLNFDIGHFYCVGDDPAATVFRLAPYIDHVHLEDIAATRVHHHLIPGEGVIDFGAALAALREVKYTGWVTVELYTCHEDPDGAARVARERVLAIAGGAGERGQDRNPPHRGKGGRKSLAGSRSTAAFLTRESRWCRTTCFNSLASCGVNQPRPSCCCGAACARVSWQGSSSAANTRCRPTSSTSTATPSASRWSWMASPTSIRSVGVRTQPTRY